jgi:ABC-2 type transport system permease protein
LIAFSLLGSALLGALGVLVSLRSATARQAYQRLSLVFIVIWVLPSVALNFIPKGVTSQLSGLMESLDYTRLLGILCLALLVIDAVLLAVDFRRFQRKNLTLI